MARNGGVLGYRLLVALLKIRKQDVADAKANATNLVGVGGANAFEGAAYFGVAAGFFVEAVEGAVAGKDELGLFGDVEVLSPVYSPIGELLKFGTEDDGVENDAIAHYIKDMGVEDAAGHLVQDVLEAVEGKGVAGVGTSLEAGNGIVSRSQYVYNFSFAFIAPLEAY
jgi:hypothetical protein